VAIWSQKKDKRDFCTKFGVPESGNALTMNGGSLSSRLATILCVSPLTNTATGWMRSRSRHAPAALFQLESNDQNSGEENECAKEVFEHKNCAKH